MTFLANLGRKAWTSNLYADLRFQVRIFFVRIQGILPMVGFIVVAHVRFWMTYGDYQTVWIFHSLDDMNAILINQ